MTRGHCRGLRVLLVDDDEEDAALTRDLLARAFPAAPPAVTWLQGAAPALAALGAGEADVCLLDYRLGPEDGLELLRRALAGGCEVPIILLTGQGGRAVDLRAMDAGAADYLQKGTFEPPQLERAIRYAVGRAEGLRALRRSEERFALAARGANDGIWDWDLDRGSLHVSGRWREILGEEAAPAELRLEAWLARIHPGDLDRVRRRLDEHLAGQSAQFEEEYRARHQDGGFRWVLTRGVAVRDGSGATRRMAGSLTDVTGRRFYDGLTGLPNRVLLLDRIETLLAHGRGRRPHRFVLLVVDLDGFRLVNEGHGPRAGDELLVQVSRLLSARLRPGDTVARLEGDEFALLLDDVSDPRDFVVVADRLRRDLDRSFWVGGHEVFLTASLGLAEGSKTLRAEDLVRDAESALRLAKGRGRGGLEIFDPAMRAAAAARLRLEASLRRAVEEGEFSLHFQPLVRLADGRPYGSEALVRWSRLAEHGVEPEEFVALAESSGLIHGLGRWVLRAALDAVARWDARGPSAALRELHVNLSRKQLAQPGFVSEVAAALAASGIAPGRLTFEVTETAVMDDPETAESRLRELAALGVGLAIDDFGKGHSSLGLLQRFPFDTLKIDREFVRELPASERQVELVKAVVALASSLGLRVVVEGIERVEQLAVVRALGCHAAQGFLFARALPESELLALLDSEPRW